jgi:hypothetical protein
MDPDYIAELLVRIRADGDVQREKDAVEERKRKADEARRKLEEKRGGKGRHIESVDV